MLSLEWTATEGWLPARITPYQNLSLDPATCVFHYAFECFEGMKAYKDKSGNIRLFRPDRNMARLNGSSARIALPTFDPDAMIDLIGKFVKEDARFIPEYADADADGSAGRGEAGPEADNSAVHADTRSTCARP